MNKRDQKKGVRPLHPGSCGSCGTKLGSATPLQTVLLRGAAAAEAWRAYLRNRAGFPRAERLYADRLPVPDAVFLRIPAFCVDRRSSCIGSQSIAVLSVGPAGRSARELHYMHVRRLSAGRGAGHADALLRRLQQEEEPLVASAAACRTWFASLVLLRNWFSGGVTLGSADIPFPGEPIPSRSEALSFVWRPDTDREQHIRYVEDVCRAQRARRSAHAERFADAMEQVLHLLTEARDNALISGVFDPSAPLEGSHACTFEACPTRNDSA